MKQNLDNHKDAPGRRRPATWKPKAIAAAILALLQACLTIEGRGIEGFILWVLILFVGYWLFFTLMGWLLERLRNRA